MSVFGKANKFDRSLLYGEARYDYMGNPIESIGCSYAIETQKNPLVVSVVTDEVWSDSSFSVCYTSIDEDAIIKDIDLLENLQFDDIELVIEEDKLDNYDEIKDYLNSNIAKILKNNTSLLASFQLSEVDRYHLTEYVKNKYYDLDYSYKRNFGLILDKIKNQELKLPERKNNSG